MQEHFQPEPTTRTELPTPMFARRQACTATDKGSSMAPSSKETCEGSLQVRVSASWALLSCSSWVCRRTCNKSLTGGLQSEPYCHVLEELQKISHPCKGCTSPVYKVNNIYTVHQVLVPPCLQLVDWLHPLQSVRSAMFYNSINFPTLSTTPADSCPRIMGSRTTKGPILP